MELGSFYLYSSLSLFNNYVNFSFFQLIKHNLLLGYYLYMFRRAVVEELAGFGAAVHTCSRNEAELNQCLKEWRIKGFVVSGSICDASVSAQREKLMVEVGSVFNGILNILVSICLGDIVLIYDSFNIFFIRRDCLFNFKA